MLPDPGERLVLRVGTSVVAVRNDDPARAGLSICATGTLALAAAEVAVVLDMTATDWATLAEAAWAVSCALAEREAALGPAATLATTEVAGHA